MTRAEVEVLLRNQTQARERRPVSFGGAACSCNPFDPCDCGGRGQSVKPEPGSDRKELTQLSLVPPAALPPPVELVLPLPPSWNRAFRTAAQPTKARHVKGAFRGERVWTARVYKSKEAEEYAATVGAHVRRQLEEPFARDVMLRVSGDIVMARAGCDLDDRFKVLLDSLQGHVFVNDEQVAEFGRVRRLVDSAHPHVRLTFEPIAVDRYGKATS